MYRFKITLALILAASMLAFAAPPLAPTQADATQTYIVLYKQQAAPSDAASAIARAGGTLVYSYDQIGVVIARSDNAAFRDNLLKDKRVEGAASTAGFGVKLNDEIETFDSVSNTSGWGDPLSYLQWDMYQIHVPEAHAITGGSPTVIVGDIDTGLDYRHPDLAPNVDFEKSASCIGGVPNPDPAAWDDGYGHGTHTAGTIAAAANGIGIVGIAPNVKIAAIKGCGDDGYCWPESIVCSFMWAGEHKLDVTNNSYFVDPYEFNCRNDPEQHAIWKAIQRAVRYAQSRGVTVVSSAGNSNLDITHLPGDLTNACVDLPVELSGVIGVSANGYNLQKSYYSSYGVGAVDVVAPGGDRRFQIPPAPIENGRVLSTFPGGYAWAQGTSMSSPHVVGVAALIISQYGKMPPGKVQAMITQTADPQPCPPDPFDPSGDGAWLATCQGGEGYNSFYG
ncbi:MAG: S8 family serine peptidase, partial [Anaerolineae bacterium]|nr:S8 family serine peptidase [Anaerolineae bacterium]